MAGSHGAGPVTGDPYSSTVPRKLAAGYPQRHCTFCRRLRLGRRETSSGTSAVPPGGPRRRRQPPRADRPRLLNRLRARGRAPAARPAPGPAVIVSCASWQAGVSPAPARRHGSAASPARAPRRLPGVGCPCTRAGCHRAHPDTAGSCRPGMCQRRHRRLGRGRGGRTRETDLTDPAADVDDAALLIQTQGTRQGVRDFRRGPRSRPCSMRDCPRNSSGRPVRGLARFAHSRHPGRRLVDRGVEGMCSCGRLSRVYRSDVTNL
jgi:hypothetical protein